jgi:hypothetical protein
LMTLYTRSDHFTKSYQTIKESIIRKRTSRYEHLDKLADNMLDLLDSKRLFSQFLGTIALSTPLPGEKVRCVRNEKFKPIYTAALVVALFEEVRVNHDFVNPYLKEILDEIFGPGNDRHIPAERMALHPELKIRYREEILKPIAKAALLQGIGSYSPEAEDIFSGDRYRQLDAEQRCELIESMQKKSIDYLKIGIGIPQLRFDTRTEQRDQIEYETEKLQFMLSLLDNRPGKETEIDDVLRIPSVYASFIVSTKPDSDYDIIFKAYDIIEEGLADSLYNAKFARLFLAMVGKFPIGSGIYFFCKETNAIEKGIVSSLYPVYPDEPYCKQITRQQIQSLSQYEVQVSPANNLYYDSVRAASDYDAEYFNLRYSDEFTWNANEFWEVQIPALTFWKKDGTIKRN